MQQRLQSLKEFIITTINSTTFLESENTDQDDETYTSDSRIEETEEDELEEEEEEGETADLLDDDDENLDQGDYFSILELPDELILRIFVFLNTKEIYNGLSQVSWRVHKMCLENRLWKKISKKTWNVKEKIPLNWRSYNILKHQLQKTTDEGGALQWQSIPRGRVWPSKRYQNTSTTVGSKIYLIGGQEAATIRFNDIFEFDTETYTFSRVEIKGPSQPPSFARHVAVGIENKIIVHGGYDGLGTYFGVSVFDVEKSTWTYVETKGDKPSARTNHAAAAIGKNLYIFGGIKRTDEDVLEDLGDMYVLDTVSFTWSEIQCIHMPAPRCGHRMLTLRGKLYLFGGGSGEHWTEVYNDIHVFDPETNDWTRIDCAGTANTTTFCSMFALDPFIFIFGGQREIKGGTDCSDVVYCYDSLAHSWHTAHPVSSKPDPRDMATMSVCGNSAFLFGGYNSKCFDDVYFLHLSKEANNALETLHNDDYSLPFSPSLSQNSLSDMANENEIENDRDIEDILSRFLQN